MSHEPKIDTHTGTATTGHEWDGIQELNTPLPRWWLWSWYLTIIGSIVYCVLYPAWPLATSYTKGTLGWSSRAAVSEELDALKASRKETADKVAAMSIEDVAKNPELLAFARAQGSAAFAQNCAACHGSGAQGAKGYPNLNDDDWLWGGKISEIYTTIQHGVRWDKDSESRAGVMTAFGRDGTLKPEEISDVADFVRSLSGLETGDTAAIERGKKIFSDNCSSCHGAEGKGMVELGAPNLADKVWLYGSDKKTVVERINVGGGGVMPAWAGRLDDETVRALAIYVHSLGGGQ